MKYKKGIATGAIALSLLVGSNVYAATPQDLGIKKIGQTFQKQKFNRSLNYKKGSNTMIGYISSINSNGFSIEIKNHKNKVTSSVDIKTDESTKYKGDSNLVLGQKVVVMGSLDKTTNIFTAKKVNLVANKVLKKKMVKA